MAKPKSKTELQEACKENFNKLNTLINSYSKSDLNKEFSSKTLNRNIRDVLTHLHHWHLMVLDWHKVGIKGEKPDMPAKGYTWQTLPELNKEIWKMYQEVDLKSARALLKQSNQKVQKVIAKHSNEELFTKKIYKWTGSTSMGAYFISNTCSHYNWALKIIKAGMK